MVLSYLPGEMRPGMTGQLGGEVPSETAPAWDSVRRVREPVAWILLVVIAVAVLVSAWQLFGLPGAPVPTPPGPVAVVSGTPVPAAPTPVTAVPSAPLPSPVAVTTFGLRASFVAPNFVAGGVFLLPVLAVILVAFAGGVTDRARQVVQAAVSIQAVALGLGLVSWLGALWRPHAAGRVVHLHCDGSRCGGGRADIHRRGAPVAGADAAVDGFRG